MSAVGVTAWTDATLAGELADMREAVDYAADRVTMARDAEAEQVARTKAVYGFRHAWPASSVYAVDTLSADLVRAVVHERESREYLRELELEAHVRQLEADVRKLERYVRERDA